MKKEIRIPDLGNMLSAEIIEIPVQVGTLIQKEMPILIVEGEKATIEIPSPYAGKIEAVLCQVGQKVSTNDVIFRIEEEVEKSNQETQSNESALIREEIKIPNLGMNNAVSVLDILVSEGSQIEIDQPLVVLESEKASVEVPSPSAGKVIQLNIKTGDKVQSGDSLLVLEFLQSPAHKNLNEKAEIIIPAKKPEIHHEKIIQSTEQATPFLVHAGPSVRRIAREFGVNLGLIKGTGRKGRIILKDVQDYVKSKLQGDEKSVIDLPPFPKYDFAKYGEIEVLELSKIKQFTAIHVYRSWITVPQVTHFEEADITELEEYRQKQKENADKKGIKLTPLVFILKAVVFCLKRFPTFNASLDPNKEKLILKKYFNIGIAVDTPKGLVVPVLRDIDKKDIYDLAKEMMFLSNKARETGLSKDEMEGSSFTISSLGGIGGVGFTPIVNLPNVAILGVSKSRIQPVFQNGQFAPRLVLPFSLSYDHRVIDGAEAARFCKQLSESLSVLHNIT